MNTDKCFFFYLELATQVQKRIWRLLNFFLHYRTFDRALVSKPYQHINYIVNSGKQYVYISIMFSIYCS